MKLSKLFFGLFVTAALFTANKGLAQEQESEQDRECLRMRFLAGEELKVQNYKGAAMYYLKGEKLCNGYDKDNYARLLGCLKNTISSETDEKAKAAYTDTILGVYERANAAGALPKEEYLGWGGYILQVPTPNRAKADSLLQEGIKVTGEKTNEAYVTYYYYNIYMMWYEAKDAAKKQALKKRIISEYFELSKLVSKAGMSTMTLETMNNYFNSVAGTCNDIIPVLKDFMGSLPKDKEAKKASVNNFIMLLETKECTSSKEYAMLIDTLIQIDPNSLDAKLTKAKLLTAQGKYSEANGVFREVREMSNDENVKADAEYYIVINLFKSGAYKSAYSAAMNVSGKYRGEALKIAAQCVAALANSCGDSTVERKANYYYAVELLERAQSAGASVGGLMSSYKANFPSSQELFDAGMEKGQSVSLSCWGTSVTLK